MGHLGRITVKINEYNINPARIKPKERESSLVDLILEHLGSDRCDGDDKHDAQGDGVKHCERAECIQEAGDATVSDL